jgi:hypothetical protein
MTTPRKVMEALQNSIYLSVLDAKMYEVILAILINAQGSPQLGDNI